MRGSRSCFSQDFWVRGSDLEKGLCHSHPGTPPLPRPHIVFPIHSFGLLPAPPSGLVFGGLCFRSHKPWGPSMSPTPGPLGASAISICWSPYLFRVLQHYGLLLHHQFPPIPTLFPLPPSLTVIPALYPSLFSFFFSELYLLLISLLHSVFLTLCPVFIC